MTCISHGERRNKMKKNIHPNYVEATVTCACGNTFKTKSVQNNNLEISSLIELSSSQEKSKIHFVAKDEIPRKQLLLTIFP